MSDGVRTIRVGYVARVEGEGSVTLRLRDGVPIEARLQLFEPPRFFEALLRERRFEEAPDITSRVCGICPVAYLLTACRAMEAATGIEVTGTLRELRRLAYAGEWIASHALHVFLLHVPDFLGYPDLMSMAKKHPAEVRRGLEIKQAGNALLELLGGREIHPINVRVGGFYRAPERRALQSLLPRLRRAYDATAESLLWAASFEFPSFERDWELVALRHPTEYAVLDGRIVSSGGLDIDAAEYESQFVEEQVPYSNALQSRRVGAGAYLCGPLARFGLNFDRLSPELQRLSRQAGLEPPCRNPFRSILVRLVELAHAFEQAIAIIERYEPPPSPGEWPKPRAGTGLAATEAPRGFLFHRYVVDDEGLIVAANIVPPTSQNQRSMEADLLAIASSLASLSSAEAREQAERIVRNHDPCISCASHFLEVRWEQA